MQWVVSNQGGGWNQSINVIGAGANTTGVELVGASPTSSFDPPVIDRFTLERIRGSILPFSMACPGAGTFNAFLGAGIIKWKKTSGAAVFPLLDPLSPADAGADWLWLHHWSLVGQVTAATNVLFSDGQVLTQAAGGLQQSCDVSAVRQQVDVKSKRVMKEGEILLLCLSANLGGSLAIQVTTYLRCLISRVA